MSDEKWFESLDEYRRKVKPWLLERDSSALLVIDLQNQFVEEGAVLEVPQTRDTLPNVKKLIDTCRDLDVPVIYTAIEHESPEAVPRFYELFPFLQGKAYLPGTREVEIYEEIAPVQGDFLVKKPLYSSFEGTNLSKIIHSAKGGSAPIDTLILVGCVTNACVESTARDAFHLNYRVALVSDACSAVFPDLHAATLRNVIHGFGRVMTTEGVIAALEHGE